MFEEGHYLAVLSPERSFYVCQTLQDIPYNSRRKFKIKWLEEIKTNEFKKVEKVDLISTNSIIDEIMLTKVSSLKYMLSETEKIRITSQIKKNESKNMKVSSKDKNKTNDVVVNNEILGFEFSHIPDCSRTLENHGQSINKHNCDDSTDTGDNVKLLDGNNIKKQHNESSCVIIDQVHDEAVNPTVIPVFTNNDVSGSDVNIEMRKTKTKQKDTKEQSCSNNSVSAITSRQKKRLVTSDSEDSEDCTINVGDLLHDDKTGKRMYNKRHVCYYCHKTVNKMSRHLEIMHSNEMDVAKILAMPKNSKQRKQHFIRLTRIGDFYHNSEVLSLCKGNLVLIRRPTSEELKTVDYADYGPCPYCLGFLLKKHLWHHAKYNCPDIKNKNDEDEYGRSTIIAESKALLSSTLPTNVPEEFVSNILNPLRNGEIGNICKQDSLILRFGLFKFEKYSVTQAELIRQSMRQIARLLIEVRKHNSIKNLSDCLKPENFDLVLEGVKDLCLKKDNINDRPTMDSPSLALKIGHHLRKCASIERGHALRNNDLIKDQQLQAFLHLMGLEWANRVSALALTSLKRRKYNATELLPLTSDLIKLNAYMEKVIHESTSDLESGNIDQVTWFKLGNATLCRILIFNKRRSGEASRIKIEEYKNKPNWLGESTEEFKKTLSPVELQLCNRLTLINVRGKKERKVAIILTEDAKRSIDVLLKYRNRITSILVQNEYIFPLAHSINHVRGDQCLKRMCEDAELDKPELITSTKLRKYMATVVQLFNLNDTECDWLARHLGHDIRVHREFYRLHESAVELTKISRLLMVVDEGNASKFVGKKLGDIRMSELPPLNESEAEDELELGIIANKDNSQEPSPQKSSKKVDQPKTAGKKNVTKRPWSVQEKEPVLNYFRKYIKTGDAPGKEECERFLAENETFTGVRNWKDIKWCVYNHIKKSKKLLKNETNL